MLAGDDNEWNGYNLPPGKPIIHVENDFMQQQLRIHIAIRRGDRLYVLHGDGTVHEYDRNETYSTAVLDKPYLLLPESLARLLLDALAAHYGGVSEARALRADLTAERARSDGLITTLSNLSEQAMYVLQKGWHNNA